MAAQQDHLLPWKASFKSENKACTHRISQSEPSLLTCPKHRLVLPPGSLSGSPLSWEGKNPSCKHCLHTGEQCHRHSCKGFDSLEGKPSRWQPHHSCKTSHLEEVCSRNNTKIHGQVLQGKKKRFEKWQGLEGAPPCTEPLCKTCVCPQRFSAYSTDSTPYQEIAYIWDLDLGQQNCNPVSLWEHSFRHQTEGKKEREEKSIPYKWYIFKTRFSFHKSSVHLDICCCYGLTTLVL